MSHNAESLLQSAIRGDGDALTSLLRAHGPAVQQRLHIAPQWRSMLEPEDVMQVTYLEAFLQIGRFDASRGVVFERWLEQIAQNNLRDAIRGLSRQKQPPPGKRVHAVGGASGGRGSGGSGGLMDSYQGLLEMLATTSATPSRAAATKENQALIDRALDELPEDYSFVIRAYDLDGKSIAEVAAELKRSAGAVHMLRARAHDCLRRALGTESMFFSTPA